MARNLQRGAFISNSTHPHLQVQHALDNLPQFLGYMSGKRWNPSAVHLCEKFRLGAGFGEWGAVDDSPLNISRRRLVFLRATLTTMYKAQRSNNQDSKCRISYRTYSLEGSRVACKVGSDSESQNVSLRGLCIRALTTLTPT
jgi:hypothetical protein